MREATFSGGELAEGRDRVEEEAARLLRGLAEPEPKIEGYLVVAASAGMQTAPDVAHPGRQLGLDEGMDVLGGRVHDETAFFGPDGQGGEAAAELVGRRLRKDALAPEHRRMGDGSLEVFGQEAPIGGSGGKESVYRGIEPSGGTETRARRGSVP